MSAAERDVRDHAKTLTSIVESLGVLQNAERARQIADAVAEERAINRGKQLQRIEADVAAIKGAGNKLLWIVIGSVVLAFLAFVYRGGLNL